MRQQTKEQEKHCGVYYFANQFYANTFMSQEKNIKLFNFLLSQYRFVVYLCILKTRKKIQHENLLH